MGTVGQHEGHERWMSGARAVTSAKLLKRQEKVGGGWRGGRGGGGHTRFLALYSFKVAKSLALGGETEARFISWGVCNVRATPNMSGFCGVNRGRTDAT